MPRKSNKITDAMIVDIVVKRITGKTQAEIAKELGVSEQTIQYYETKEASQEFKANVLKRIADGVGDVLLDQALERLNLGQRPKQDEDDDSDKFILKLESGATAPAQ